MRARDPAWRDAGQRAVTPAWSIDEAGWVQGLTHRPSPHCDARPPGCALELAVIHNISLPPGKFGEGQIEALFAGTLDPAADPYFEQIVGLRVSAHFLVARDGTVTQFVSCADRAWHAGLSEFEGRARCNDFSIGIELEGTDLCVFEPEQYDAAARLLDLLARHYPIVAVAGHSDIAPGRKTDPGPCFDWRRLRTRMAAVTQLEFPFV
ncbi:MAG: 1,6-anhydro-N-acetylmuramyl-L-alanine amidase AmpD [Burkholderiaceae bacterium]